MAAALLPGQPMPARCVVDASVAAKWLAPEPDSEQAAALLDAALLAPDLLLPEVANILWKKQSRGEMAVATATAAARWLRLAPLQLHDSGALLDDALALAMRLNHPAYDCFYLALAMQADCPLVTADRRLVERCRRADARDLAGHVLDLEVAARTLGQG